MSGVFGIRNLDGAPLDGMDLQRMASVLARRGPEGTGYFRQSDVGLGHTLLATTPEAVWERLPLTHEPTGCVITADVRLDNRDELLGLLGLRDRASIMGDAEIVLACYLRWGTDFVARLLGDFVFAIWDPRSARLFCARDQFGMRPFYYHHTPGRFFAFASEAKAIVVLEQTPYRINEGRIADFLVSELEGIDFTSTFFEDVYRLPPAHAITVANGSVEVARYWTLEAGPELRLKSDQEYAEAFLEVFTESVRSRLRSDGPVGSMLSGGMDSGSVVAVASRLLASAGKGPLPTFSATSPDPTTCIETRTIRAAMRMPGLDCHEVNHGQLAQLEPELSELTWGVAEPFDGYMTLPRAVYMTAHRFGCKVLLDGVMGDVVLAGGTYIIRLIRRGRWLSAVQEAVGLDRFYSGELGVWRDLARRSRSALATNGMRDMLGTVFGASRARRRASSLVDGSLISEEFARRVRLESRARSMDAVGQKGIGATYGMDCANTMSQPHVTVARERYDRVASAVSIEARDPFLDQRVVAMALRLPGAQRLGDGWPKIILRRAMQGLVPDEVRWRRGKEHLGWAFTVAWGASAESGIRDRLRANRSCWSPYVSPEASMFWDDAEAGPSEVAKKQMVYELSRMGEWMHSFSTRPTAVSNACVSQLVINA